MPNKSDLTSIEIALLVEAIYKRYGYDFRNYQSETLRRRVEGFQAKEGLESISGMIPKLLHSKAFFEELFYYLSITVTEMFREPGSFKLLEKFAVPRLKTYPYINVWHAGCATGEEIYSMAIFLKEQGLYDRAQIYATDINERALQVAREGVYQIQDMKRNTENYNSAGGIRSLSDYYIAKYDRVRMDPELGKNITFSNHNLVIDGVFAEMHLIFCRNVLMYFNPELQNRTIKLFTDSLCHHGYLCLGSHESLRHSSFSELFKEVEETKPLYYKQSTS